MQMALKQGEVLRPTVFLLKAGEQEGPVQQGRQDNGSCDVVWSRVRIVCVSCEFENRFNILISQEFHLEAVPWQTEICEYSNIF